MRDFRDAKAMAQSLRQALAAKDHPVTHGEALELIAKAFAFDNWNILAAKIGAENAPAPAMATPGSKTLHCSFCGKGQQEVAILIAGPDTFICGECVELCDDIIDDTALAQQERDAKDVDPRSIVRAYLAGMGDEQLLRSKHGAERQLGHVEWSLGQVSAFLEGRPREPAPGAGRGDPLKGKRREDIEAMQDSLTAQKARILTRIDIAETLLSERQPAGPA